MHNNSRFIELFGDPVGNPKGWTTVPLGTRCEIITGNTPSRAEAKNYGELTIQKSLDELETLNKALMQKYFGGNGV